MKCLKQVEGETVDTEDIYTVRIDTVVTFGFPLFEILDRVIGMNKNVQHPKVDGNDSVNVRKCFLICNLNASVVGSSKEKMKPHDRSLSTCRPDVAVSTVYQCVVERPSHSTLVIQLTELPNMCTDEEDGDTKREDCLL